MDEIFISKRFKKNFKKEKDDIRISHETLKVQI